MINLSINNKITIREGCIIDKQKNYFIPFLLLLSFLAFYFYSAHNSSNHVIGDSLASSTDKELFHGGYSYLLNEDYKEALNYYSKIKDELEDDYFLDKQSRLVIILQRLINSQELYDSEKDLLEMAENFNDDYLDPWYGSLMEIYDFYNLSVEVILEDNYAKEDKLVSTYLKNISYYEDFLEDINQVDSPFFTDTEKTIFSNTIQYSIMPTEVYYKTTHLAESITMEEIEMVEKAWAKWDKYYIEVMDYYQAFDEGLYELIEEVDALKEGYLDMKRQLSLLLPDLKMDQIM